MASDNDIKPLYNEEAEQSVIGGIFIDNTAYDKLVGVITEYDFYPREHRMIFRAISRLMEESKPVDVVTVGEFLDRHKLLDDAGGLPYLINIIQNTPSAANVYRYAEIVRDYSLMRKMGAISAEISEKISKRDGLTARDLLDFAQSRWMTVGDSLNRANNTMQKVGDVMVSVIDKIDEMYMRESHDDVTGLRTGIDDLDKLTTGMQPGELNIIAARPSMGKTSLALNIVENVALKQVKNAAVFSLEMINNQLGMRLLSSVARLPAQRVSIGRVNDDEWSLITKAVHDLKDAGIYLDEESTLNVNDIRARARRLHRELKGELHLIVIDYIGLIATTGNDSRANEMADISRALKLLAKELHIPIIALAQLNRGLEQRPNKRPVMSDLRDSGGLEQDADNIFFIYRDEVYHPDTPDKGTAELIVAKQRNGPIGMVRTTFVPHLMRFENFRNAYE
ncbi:replicative DNA helicase [Methylotenera oryzisoli]|uniref:Replicative DNA helicase n=1 Tax=Methylotenera oryzisoli TaxID=2080758 RepID=A0A4Y9VTW7_9PROT|nr:replicative DNA helicase [Methylotenera oryzisoli]TFW72082.1 replicative DNA helicase [Methylotenera oryzisoli]